MTSVLTEKIETQTHIQGECRVTMWAEIKTMLLPVKEYQRSPENHQRQDEGHGTDSSSQSSERGKSR